MTANIGNHVVDFYNFAMWNYFMTLINIAVYVNPRPSLDYPDSVRGQHF